MDTSKNHIVSISCVKNEDDIVEAFVRHTSRHIDRLIVLDNGSTDSTLDVLYELRKEGLPLEIIVDRSIGYWQSERMSSLMKDQAVRKYSADWIFPLDADEFIVLNSDLSLHNMLESKKNTQRIKWRTYIPDRNDDMDENNPAIRIQHRLKEELKTVHKVIIPGSIAEQENITIAQGNHYLMKDGVRMDSEELEFIHLAHLPVRSAGQYGSKIVLGYLQYLTMHRRRTSWGKHYIEPYALIKNDPGLFFASFIDRALYFGADSSTTAIPETIFDPIPYAGGKISFFPSDKNEWWTLVSLIEYTENLAGEYNQLIRQIEELEKELSSFKGRGKDSGRNFKMPWITRTPAGPKDSAAVKAGFKCKLSKAFHSLRNAGKSSE